MNILFPQIMLHCQVDFDMVLLVYSTELACTEESLLENVIQCTSIVTSAVIPLSSKKDLASLKQACK